MLLLIRRSGKGGEEEKPATSFWSVFEEMRIPFKLFFSLSLWRSLSVSGEGNLTYSGSRDV